MTKTRKKKGFGKSNDAIKTLDRRSRRKNRLCVFLIKFFYKIQNILSMCQNKQKTGIQLKPWIPTDADQVHKQK